MPSKPKSKPTPAAPPLQLPPRVPTGAKLPQPPGVKPQPVRPAPVPGRRAPLPRAPVARSLPKSAAPNEIGPTLEPGSHDPNAGVGQVNPTVGSTPVAPHGQAGAGVAAALRKIPLSQKVHYKELHPGMSLIRNPITGADEPIQFRTGGQYSVRRLVVVNNATGSHRIVLVRNSDEQQVWPLAAYERIADPTEHPEDAPLGPGNFEVVFDDEREYREYWKAHGHKHAAIFDPLKLNDVPDGQFPPDMNLPGGGPPK